MRQGSVLDAKRSPARKLGSLSAVSPTWIWMQIAIVVFVMIGMVVAITKLA
jgi:hypothetical protein